MTLLSKAAFLTKYNDAGTGLYRAGQSAGAIGSDDHREKIIDIKDSVLFLEDTNARVSLDTSVNPVINMATLKERVFLGSVPIAVPRTWSFTNFANAIKATVFFTLSGVDIQTFPANVFMQNFVGNWDNTLKQWTPIASGNYESEFTYDGTNFYLKIHGPY